MRKVLLMRGNFSNPQTSLSRNLLYLNWTHNLTKKRIMTKNRQSYIWPPPPRRGGGGEVTRNIVGTHACPKNVEKGSLFWPKASTTSLRKRVVFQSNLRRFWEKGLLLSCPAPFRGRFWHQGLRDLGSNFEVLGRAWVPLQFASDPPPPPPRYLTGDIFSNKD